MNTHSRGASDGRIALVLQGGGALGAYQAGAFEALAAGAYDVNWVAGISIGAVNAALIAGNPPERRVERLRAFWDTVSLALPTPVLTDLAFGPMRSWWDTAVALFGAWQGVPGFFAPRPPLAWWPQPPPSWYDTAPLRKTLEELVDFNLLNDGSMRCSVGAVDVESGNFTYFDNHQERIGVEHVMASGALPPGFAAIEVDERWYWDGGVVSNTPLSYVMRNLRGPANAPITVFQVDLFSARGGLPGTLPDVVDRLKEIQYSSRTRSVSDHVRERHQLHRRLQRLAALLPPDQRNAPHVQELLAGSDDPSVTLIQVIRRRSSYETQTKDYEFSRLSMSEHWSAGLRDMGASLELLRCQPPIATGEFRVLDYQPDAPQGPRLDRVR